MLELTGITGILRAASVVYWLFAVALLILIAWKVKQWAYKAIGVAIVVGLFGYQPLRDWQEAEKREAYAREAWSYFKKKCDTESGEKISRTFTDVRSVLVVKPLPPAKPDDEIDQFWYGDPYSSPPHSGRGVSNATALTLNSRRPSGPQKGLDFVEIRNDAGDGYLRIHRPASNDERARKEEIKMPVSKFGVSWEDISTPGDRKYWVAGSRLSIIDLKDGSVVAERIGFLIEPGFGSHGSQRRPWLTGRTPGTTCPPISGGDYSDNWFVTNVFKQDKEK